MIAPGRPGPDDSSFGRTVGDAMGRGAILVAIAFVIGAFLIWQGLDSGDGATASAGDDSVETDADGGDADAEAEGGDGAATGTTVVATDGGDGTVTVPPVTAAPVAPGVTRPPSEVNVLSANGSGVGGAASAVADRLNAANYLTNVANTDGQTDTSKIYYRDTYGEEAKAVAAALGAPADVIQPMPADPGIDPSRQDRADAANVIVVIGKDGKVPTA